MPSHYIASIGALVQTFRLDLQYAANEMDMDLDGDASEADNRTTSVIPLVVNTQGWTKGLGADLMAAVGELVQPTHVFELKADTLAANANERSRESAGAIKDIPSSTSWIDESIMGTSVPHGEHQPTQHWILPAAPLGPIGNFFNPSDTRAINLLTYFHAGNSGQRGLTWRTDMSLLTTPPYDVDVNVAFDAIILTGPGSEDVVYEEVLRSLNCSIVALVEDENSTDILEGGGEAAVRGGIPYVQGTLPPDPSTSRCHGLAFARGVSTLNSSPGPAGASERNEPSAKLQLLTPVPPNVLARCRVLVKGELEMPIWAFVGSSSDGDLGGREWKGSGKKEEGGGGTVLGVPWEKVPYLTFRGAREMFGGGGGVIAGSGVKKARKNVMRRGHM